VATPTGHETRDVDLRSVLLVTLAVLLAVAASFAVMRLLEGGLASREARRSPPPSPLAATYAVRQPPPPRLQPDPARDLGDFRAGERSVLDQYAWIDRDAGRVRIPIARAMEVLVQRGRPRGAATGAR